MSKLHANVFSRRQVTASEGRLKQISIPTSDPIFIDVKNMKSELNPLRPEIPKPGTLTNSGDPDDADLLRQNQSSERKMLFFENVTCDPSIYTMDQPGLTVSNFMGNSIGTKRVNLHQTYVVVLLHKQSPFVLILV